MSVVLTYLDALNLLRDHLRVAFAKFFATSRLVVECAVVRVVIAMLSTVQSTATALESSQSDPFVADLTAVFALLGCLAHEVGYVWFRSGFRLRAIRTS